MTDGAFVVTLTASESTGFALGGRFMNVSFPVILVSTAFASVAHAAPLKVGQDAPDFASVNQANVPFKLSDRKDKGWTVLYFYPKAGTPGCTKQACAFRDAIKPIREQGAEVYGISTDTVADQAKFHAEQKLNFDLLADPEARATEAFGVKMPVMKMAKRWTFILDPKLKVRYINDSVDPVLDAKLVAGELEKLRKQN